MLTSLIPEEMRLDFQKQVHGDAVLSAYLEQLQKGEIKILFSIIAGQIIRYEAFKEGEKPFYACVEVGPSYPAGYRIRSFQKESAFALLCFLIEDEENATEEALAERYGSDYYSLNNLRKLKGKDLKKYLNAKSALACLVQKLKDQQRAEIVSPSPAITITPKLEIALQEEDGYFHLFLTVIGRKHHPINKLSLFLNKVRENSLVSDGGGNYLRFGVSNWSRRDQALIFFLSDLQDKTSASYRYVDPLDLTNKSLFQLLEIIAGENVTFNEQPYQVAEDIKEINVSINENGSISQDGQFGREIATEGLFTATVSQKARQILRFHYRNGQEKALADFIAENPDIPFDLLQEEISAEVLPVLNKDVAVSGEFRKKAQAYRSDIAYYLSYESEEDTPHLHAETKFLMRGIEVTKEDYLLSANPHYDEFIQELERLGLMENGEITDDQQIGAILESDFSNLSSCCSLYLSDNISPTSVKHSTNISLRTVSGLDWFSVSFESDTLTTDEVNTILKAYRKKKKYVRVGSSFFATDDQALAQAIKDFSPEDQTEINNYQLPLYQALKLQTGTTLRVSIDQQLQSLFQSLLNYRSTDLKCSASLKKALRPYQKDGVKWLLNLASHSLGGILADDMGLGKTLEVIAYLNASSKDLPSLIVAPKSLIYNWASEFAKWDPSQHTSIVVGDKNERKNRIQKMKKGVKGVYIVSYDSLRNDEALYRDIPFQNVILDEAQAIANAAALKSKAVKTLNAKQRFVLTGTPIQNSFMDLWSIMDFLLPGYLEGYKAFHMVYGNYSDNLEAEIHALEVRVAPFLLRRTKEEVLKDLPPKSEETVFIDLETEESRLYKAYEKNVQLTLLNTQQDQKNRIAILAELTRLRELCVDPSIFVSNFDGTSSKLTRCLEMIQEAVAGGHKILVFSSFVTVLKHLQSILDQASITSSLIYGDTPAKERVELANEFNTSADCKVMLVSLKAGGTGLNLIGADIVIHLDPWWNVAAENQASDRAHRIGQTRPVSIYKFVAHDTIEEKILSLQELKKGLSNIVRVADSSGNSLTEEDIRYLLLS
ncbi:MAG: SNF2-related protein [Candidatus Enteromonas sp.]